MTATWDEFERLELAVGVITGVEDFPEAWLEKDPERAWKNPPPCE